MAAAALSVDELALDKAEATQLAKAIADVADLYPVEFDPRTAAWVSLGVAVAMVEGPRAWFVYKKLQADKARAARPAKPPSPPVTTPAAGGAQAPAVVRRPAPTAPAPSFPDFNPAAG